MTAGRSLARRIAFWTLGTGLLLALLGSGGVAGVFWFHGRDLAKIDEAALRAYRPPQVSRVLARDGTLIGEIFTERRTVIAYDDVPHHVEDAFLAAEDADFYRHEGMDYLGMVRALFANLRAGEIRQGASTITQQVVKNFLLSPERTFERKVQELILARRLEQVLDKREILTLYLNDIYLGEGRYGIEEASRCYFGKGVAEIDLGQAALLATLPKAPTTGSPLRDPVKAKERQIYVLEQMSRHGFATPQDVKRYIAAPLELADCNRSASAEVAEAGAQEFVDAARAKLIELYGEDAIDSLGATVTTTVDLRVQAAARAGVLAGLTALDKRRGFGHGIKPAKAKNRERALAHGKDPLRVGNIYPVVIDARRPEQPSSDGFPAHIGEHEVFVKVPAGSRYDEPDVTLDEQFPAGGITMVRVLSLAGADPASPQGPAVGEVASGPEAAVVLADVKTGEVLALVGGSDFGRGDFNRVIAARRQPGSAFKPVIYGAALASRDFTAASLIMDSPEVYEKWRPTNYERDVYRGDIRMRVALTHSVNTVAIKLLDQLGIPRVHDFARALGIESPLVDNISLALGTSEVSPIELMRAYGTLARGGSRVEPILVRSVDAPAREPWRAVAEQEATVAPEVAFILTSMMRSVVEEGTGQRAAQLGRPLAGKTGTSDDSKDAWFAGYTPRHVAVAWLGFDVPKKLTGESGGKAAIPIWLAAMTAAEAGLDPLDFVSPPGVTVRTIDRRSGLLAPPPASGTDGAPVPADPTTTLEEYFIAGTEPVETALAGDAQGADLLLDLYVGGDATAPATTGAGVEPPGGEVEGAALEPPGQADEGLAPELPDLDTGQ